MSSALDLSRLLSALSVAAAELVLAAGLVVVLYTLIVVVLSRVAPARSALGRWSSAIKGAARTYLLFTFALIGAAILAFNSWLFAQGVDVRSHTIQLALSFDEQKRMALAAAFGKLALAALIFAIAIRVIRRILRSCERALNRWDRISRNNRSLAELFGGLNRVAVNTGWLLLAAFAARWFGFPASVSGLLLLAIRIYLIIVVGILVIRSSVVIVDTLDGWSERSARRRGWTNYYAHARPLVPTFRACLDYALWIGLASLVLLQIRQFGYLAAWGPRLIHGIGLFFIGRVVVELGSLEIGNRMLPGHGLDAADRQRRETMVPLVRSIFGYGVYFATAVLILSALGFNPMPFLAGAGILGLVIGFGAQSMINDVVSGFFILFENTFLVGDVVEIGPAKGRVEAIEFRTTKIRDADGRVHVIRNGDLKPVVNCSKDYIRAVVTVDVAYDADLRNVFNVLVHAGERLREQNADVLADLEIGGITTFNPQTMTIRTSVRARPGRHESVAAELRLVINELFDRQSGGAPRKTLIPAASAGFDAPGGVVLTVTEAFGPSPVGSRGR
jgi:small conductance mechanosensitive channel